MQYFSLDNSPTENRGTPVPKRAGKELTELHKLSSSSAIPVAHRLKKVLDLILFDETLNPLVRADYAVSPQPLGSLPNLQTSLGLVCDELSKMSLNFFLLGRSVNRFRFAHQLQQLFDQESEQLVAEDLINEWISVGLVRESGKRSVALNELLLSSREVASGMHCYIFADAPDYLLRRPRHQRVYIGPDSYLLQDRLMVLQNVVGHVVEPGSGSGIQLITLLLRNPSISVAIGIECDERARNVANFNAALNGVQNRFTQCTSIIEYRSQFAGLPIDLLVSNPPFFSIPDEVSFDSSRTALATSDIFPISAHGGPDGLRFISEILNGFCRDIATNGKIIVLGQVLGDEHGPTVCISELHKLMNVFDVRFEGFKSPASRQSAQQWATGLGTIAGHNVGSQITAGIVASSLASLASFQATHIHTGFLTLTPASSIRSGNFENIPAPITYRADEAFILSPSVLEINGITL